MSETILQKIAEHNRQIVHEKKKKISFEEMKEMALHNKRSDDFPFRKALGKDGLSYICEVKKASPSKGVIAEVFEPVSIAKAYENAGADAISCLTEPKWFLGRDEYVKQITEHVSIPVLRKDFIVDSYMVYESCVLGASAVLLICALLDETGLKTYRLIAEELGMDALVEAHDEEEIQRAIRSGAKIIGVNNRDLHTFTVDVHLSDRYRNYIPKDILFVSESGIQNRNDIEVLEKNGTNAVLIGETLMRANGTKEILDQLKGIRR